MHKCCKPFWQVSAVNNIKKLLKIFCGWWQNVRLWSPSSRESTSLWLLTNRQALRRKPNSPGHYRETNQRISMRRTPFVTRRTKTTVVSSEHRVSAPCVATFFMRDHLLFCPCFGTRTTIPLLNRPVKISLVPTQHTDSTANSIHERPSVAHLVFSWHV